MGEGGVVVSCGGNANPGCRLRWDLGLNEASSTASARKFIEAASLTPSLAVYDALSAGRGGEPCRPPRSGGDDLHLPGGAVRSAQRDDQRQAGLLERGPDCQRPDDEDDSGTIAMGGAERSARADFDAGVGHPRGRNGSPRSLSSF